MNKDRDKTDRLNKILNLLKESKRLNDKEHHDFLNYLDLLIENQNEKIIK